MVLLKAEYGTSEYGTIELLKESFSNKQKEPATERTPSRKNLIHAAFQKFTRTL